MNIYDILKDSAYKTEQFADEEILHKIEKQEGAYNEKIW